LDLDKAIENAAQMQMLGGSAAVNFGNPLAAAYEANYDPEAFAKRMSDSLASYASFDTKSGMGRITNAADMDMVRNIAKVMGISVDDASKMAKKQAEVRYKESQFMPKLESLGLSEDQRNFIINNAQVTNQGRDLELNGMNLEKLAANPQKLKELMDFEGMSDKDILYQQSTQLTSIDEHISGASAKVAASFAEGVNKYLGDFGKQIQEIGNFLSGHAKNWGKSVGEALMNFSSWVKENGPTMLNTFQSVLNGVDKIVGLLGPLSDWIKNNPWKALFAYVGLKSLPKMILPSGGPSASARAASSIGRGLRTVGRGAVGVARVVGRGIASGARTIGRGVASGSRIIGRGVTSGARAAGRGGKWLGNRIYDLIGRGGANHSWRQARNYARNAYRMTNGSPLRKGIRGAKSLWGNSKAFRASVRGGGAVIGALGNVATDYLVNSGKIKRGGKAHYAGKITSTAAQYAALGSMLGPIGTSIGAAVGAVKGAYDTWKSLPENADKNFIDYAKSCGKSIVEGGKAAFTFGKDKIGSALSFAGKEIQDRGGYLTVALNALTTPIRVWIKTLEGIAKLIVHPVDTIKSIWEKLTNWLSGDNVLGRLFNKAVNLIIGEKETHANGGFVKEGAIGIEHPIPYAQKGEVVLNPTQQRNFMALANDASSVRAKEYGAEREYIYKPNGSETSNVNGNTITVKDFNINLSGTLRLDGGNASRNIDMNALLNDYQFINTLKEMIKTSINNDMNGGRFMNDLATRRGHVSSSSIIGR